MSKLLTSLTTSDGSGTGLTVRITSVSTGAITGVAIVDGGKGYAVDTDESIEVLRVMTLMYCPE